MRYRLLGRSGLRVSELCLGTMTFGEEWGWGSRKEESRAVYDRFRAAGGNFIDTANIYTNGSSESLLGEFMQGHRQEIVLATKYGNAATGTDANAAGNQRKSMVQACEASLRRLKTDYIDLYWLHVWDQITPLDEVMRAFDDLVRQGKILYIGVSNAPAWVIARMNTLAEGRGWSQFVGLQAEYNLIERDVERELLPMAQELGLGVTAWSPLQGGLLTGKYLDDPKAKDARYASEMMRAFIGDPQRTDKIVRVVREVSREVGRSAAQVALAWLRQRDAPVIPIIGARKLAQLDDNLGCIDLTLDEQQRARLDEASKFPLGYPQNLYDNELVLSMAYGGMVEQIDTERAQGRFRVAEPGRPSLH
jgi:aryl-alcohol dehydrogenase-like predicted oxidoreductase